MGLKAEGITSDKAAEIALELTRLTLERQLALGQEGGQSKEVYPRTAKDVASLYAAMFKTVTSGEGTAPLLSTEKR